ncbi:MAG: pantetheine-phosphate adenylyltransferase [Clostridia bacterium]|nr:pantetheine-phosphate adenylyltransferase [Clostridia bacterium]
MRMKRALIPGSFDPITVGHLDVIRRTAAKFDRVYVAVMTNNNAKFIEGAKTKQYMFSMEERRLLAELACEGLPNVKVVASDGMLIDLVDKLKADWIIKGLRNESDYLYEQPQALWNRAHNPKAETLYLPCDPAYDEISSTLVRSTLAAGGDISALVPPAAAAWIAVHPRT